MNIYSKKGSKVKVTIETAGHGLPADKENVGKYLVIDKIYTVEKTIVCSSFTWVSLQEIEGIRFNSVNFDSANPEDGSATGMRPNMSFQERAKLGMELLAKQPPVTLEQARAQVLWLKKQSNAKNKKKRN